VAGLLSVPGLAVIQKINFSWALTYWPDQGADFGDALVAAAAKVRKEAQVATFDKAMINSLRKVGIKITAL
jgi:predicted nucleic-acid-binding protein